MINIIVNGCNGKMGREIINAIADDTELALVGKSGNSDMLTTIISTVKPHVVIDFTNPKTAYKNAEIIISGKCNGIIGTTGITIEQRDTLESMALKNNVGVLIAPNFCIGAIVMMKLAAEAAKYLPHIEIVEYHHDQKADAPSGTAIATAEYINAAVSSIQAPAVLSKEMLTENSQGACIGNIRIHAVRLPGFVASQEVILGAKGQTLTIRHDTINREAFMPGILYATKEIIGRKGLYFGLESLLFQDK